MKGRKLSKKIRDKISNSNYHKNCKGEKHPSWKGGILKSSQGYIIVYNPKHPFAVYGYVKRARLVIEKYLGRYLKSKEIIHHKGIHFPIKSIENRQDDSIENLQLFVNNSEHLKFHHPKGKQFGK